MSDSTEPSSVQRDVAALIHNELIGYELSCEARAHTMRIISNASGYAVFEWPWKTVKELMLTPGTENEFKALVRAVHREAPAWCAPDPDPLSGVSSRWPCNVLPEGERAFRDVFRHHEGRPLGGRITMTITTFNEIFPHDGLGRPTSPYYVRMALPTAPLCLVREVHADGDACQVVWWVGGLEQRKTIFLRAFTSGLWVQEDPTRPPVIVVHPDPSKALPGGENA